MLTRSPVSQFTRLLKLAVYVLFIAGGLMLHATRSAVAVSQDAVFNACSSESSTKKKECLRLCLAARKDGSLGMFSNVAISKCEYVIELSETKNLKGNKACSKSHCIIRLKNRGNNVLVGSGFTITSKWSQGVTTFTLVDPRKRVTKFSHVGTARGWQYESGPLKSADTAPAPGGLVLKVRRSEL